MPFFRSANHLQVDCKTWKAQRKSNTFGKTEASACCSESESSVTKQVGIKERNSFANVNARLKNEVETNQNQMLSTHM